MIAQSQERNLFPIVGYSYYEYAKSLKENDPGIALLFSEYALELSNLDLYFDQGRTSYSFDWGLIATLLAGLVLGLVIGVRLRQKD